MIRLLCLLILALPLAAQSQKPVDLAEDPSASLLLENEYVRVWRIEVGAQKSTALHRHATDYVRVALSDAEFTVLNEQGMGSVTFTWPVGETRFLSRSPAQAHRINNVAATGAMEILEIEILRGQLRADYPSSPAAVESMAYDSFRIPLERDKSFHITHLTPALVAAHDQLTPGDSTKVHEHRGPHLVIPITDLELRSEAAGGGEPQTLTAAKGDVQWVEGGGRHKLTNAGTEPARWITLEFR